MFQFQCSPCHSLCHDSLWRNVQIYAAAWDSELQPTMVTIRMWVVFAVEYRVVLSLWHCLKHLLPDALLQSQAFECSHLLWWTTAYEHTDLITYSVGLVTHKLYRMTCFKQNIIWVYSTTIFPHTSKLLHGHTRSWCLYP
jgi:hypothetical protein